MTLHECFEQYSIRTTNFQIKKHPTIGPLLYGTGQANVGDEAGDHELFSS